MKNNFFILTILCFVLGFLACQKEQTTKHKNEIYSTEIRSVTLCPGGETSPPAVYITGATLVNGECCVSFRFQSSYTYHAARITTTDPTGSAGNKTIHPFNTGNSYVTFCFPQQGTHFSVEVLDGNGDPITCNICANQCN